MKKLLWVDLEMTGLAIESNRIIEFAMIITDIYLNILEKMSFPISVEEKFISNMDDWNTSTHTKNGLINDIKKSGKLLLEVELKAVSLIEKHFKGQNVLLTGSTLSLDRLFIDTYMPKLANKLHYRIVDVASFRAIFQGYFNIYFPHNSSHRALDDIFEAIKELKLYYSFFDKKKINDFISDES